MPTRHQVCAWVAGCGLLVPIALSAGEPGSEIQAPMAIVIMCGLFSSTALNMAAVPILSERFGRASALYVPQQESV